MTEEQSAPLIVYETGPFIQVACLCESVIEDKSGVFSLIRIVDRVINRAQGPNPPSELPPFTYQFFIVVMLKSGTARGRSHVKIVPELPNGTTKNPLEVDAFFEGEEHGANIILQISFTFEKEGLHWFEIYVNEVKITSIPLRVIYQRLITTMQPGLEH